MQIKKVQKKETKIGQINRKNLPRLLVLGFLFAFVLTSLAFVALVTYRKRSIPKDWSVYSNKYYGYSVFYDPNQFFVQTDSYGPESGEDISIIINKINRASFNGRDSTEVIKNLLQENVRSREQWSPDPKTVLWKLSFSKPYLLSSEELALLSKCGQLSTKTGVKYFSCPNKFLLPLTFPYEKTTPFIRILTESVSSDLTEDDKKLVAEMLRSINLEAVDLPLTYPTKGQLERSVRPMLCAIHSHSYNNFDICENGLKVYDPYLIASAEEIIKTVNLVKPLSYCKLDISFFPDISGVECPYPGQDDLYDIYSLGQCGNRPLCGKPLVEDGVYENTSLGKSTALAEIVKLLSVPGGWEYYVSSWGNFAIAAPVNWDIHESMGGAQGKEFNFVNVVSPDKKLKLSINDASRIVVFRTETDIPASAVKLGTFFCGRYASCGLVRYKSDDPMFKVPVYEYGLYRLNEANIFSLPNQVLIYIHDETTGDIGLVDRMVKTLLTLSPEN